jgi:hypothetical protein
MRSRMTALLATAALGCGGSDQAENTPAQSQPAQTQSAPARPRPPEFPAADRFQLGEAVAVRSGGGAAVECNKLYFGDAVVAIVETYFHAGPGAAVRRCAGSAWADPSAPTADELAAVGDALEGSVAAGYDGIGITTEGTLTFTSLDLQNRVSGLSFARRWAAYASTGAPRDASGGGQEADIIGVVYDVPGRFAIQEFLLGTCQLPASGTLSLGTPTWAEDGLSLVYHGSADVCSFEEVEAHPE